MTGIVSSSYLNGTRGHLPSPKLDDLIRRKSIYYFQAVAERTVLFSDAGNSRQSCCQPMAAGHCVQAREWTKSAIF